MKTYSLPRRNGATLLRDAAAYAKQERDGRDLLVVDIAEIVARKVYREAGYSTPLSYCTEELELSEKAPRHRIHVARKAWRFPALLGALMVRRLNLMAVSLLAAHLKEENVEELVADAQGKTKDEIRQLVQERFPRRDLFNASAAPATEPLFVAPGGAGGKTPSRRRFAQPVRGGATTGTPSRQRWPTGAHRVAAARAFSAESEPSPGNLREAAPCEGTARSLRCRTHNQYTAERTFGAEFMERKRHG